MWLHGVQHVGLLATWLALCLQKGLGACSKHGLRL